jgi:phage gp16-like protein
MAALRALQQTVHVACRELGLDGEARRDLQLAVTGKASMRDMTDADLEKLLDRLKADGFKPQTGHRPAAPRADLRLVHVLWRRLGEAGLLERTGRAGLNAFVRARFGAAWGSVPADIDMLRDHKQIDMLVEALKQWCRRAGLDIGPGGRAR